MATKVKDTPILRGKDAERFNKKMRDAEKNPISKKEYDRMLTVFKSVRININQPMDELEFVRLGVNDDRDKNFDCGNDDLNEFFFEDSKGNCRELMAVSYAWCLHGKTVAFFSVSNDSITKQDVENFNKFRKSLPWRKRYKTMPSVKIGRFAVHKDFKRNKYGSRIMDFIKIWFVTLNKTGCRFIIVDALKEAIPFYENNGFLPLGGDKESDTTKLMFFDLITVAKHAE